MAEAAVAAADSRDRGALRSGLRSLSRTFPSVGGHLAVLDGLRGIALLLVVFSHASLLGIDMIPGVDMSGTGKVGVWLFFVLSSFLLMHQFLHLDAAGRLDGRAWWRYAVRRLLRIYPLYTLFLLVCWLAPLRTAITGADVLSHLAVVEGRWHLWSIAVEVKYYLLLPLLVLVYIHLARRSLALATLLTAAGIGVREWRAPEFDNDALWTYIAIFLAGSWVAIAHHYLAHRTQSREQVLRYVAAPAASALFLLLMVMTPSIWARLQEAAITPDHWHRSFTLFAMLWGAFLLSILQSPLWLQNVFAWLPLRVLGVISFSAYLWHPLVLVSMARLRFVDGGFAQALVAFVALVLVSAVSYVIIERPFLEIGRTLGARKTALRGADPAP
jgi:peptidoglycan/LPS O-acetylase OafA/YrhL